MTNEDAYAPVMVSTQRTKRKRSWLRRFVILNAVLISIPLVLIVAVYVWLRSNGMQPSGSSGSIGIATMVFFTGYFAMPNLLFLLVWYFRRRNPLDAKNQ